MCTASVTSCHMQCPTGSEELQLLLECAEVYQQPAQLPDETQPWAHVFAAIVSCPYPALVEFNTRHGRTLLTLAERSLEAALAAAAAAGPGDSSGRSSSSSSSNRARQAPMETPANRMKAAGHLATCLCCCLSGEKRMEAAAGSNCYESKCGFWRHISATIGTQMSSASWCLHLISWCDSSMFDVLLVNGPNVPAVTRPLCLHKNCPSSTLCCAGLAWPAQRSTLADISSAESAVH
jgi:hypothetical protein